MFTAAQEIIAGAIIVAATVLVALGKMPSGDWQTLATWIFGIFVSGKTIQAAGAALTAPPKVVAEVTPPKSPAEPIS